MIAVYNQEAMHRGPLVSGLLLALTCLRAQSLSADWNGPSQPVYIVTQNHYAEGFGNDGPTAKFSDLVMIEIYHPKGQSGSGVYTIGQRYPLFQGGQRTGNVRIEKIAPLQCDGSAAIVSLDQGTRLQAGGFGLSANIEGIRTHANPQRKPNPAERAAAIRAAAREFRKRGVPEASIPSMRASHLIATAVSPGGQSFLIGDLSIKTSKALYSLFLAARMNGSSAIAELASYHEQLDLEDGKDAQSARFVDQLDLDGDGVDEIVVELIGYESEGFLIYKRVGGAWKSVWSGGQSGC